jgi:5-methylcytosine-specific restriction protein A
VGESPHALPDPDFADGGAAEGAVFLRTHLRRERDTKPRRRKLDEARQLGRPIACEACGFDFFETYGDRGSDYIECHHRTPLHVTGPVKTQLKDLTLICSNCHRMIHRSTPWLTVEALCDLVHSRRNGTGVVAG